MSRYCKDENGNLILTAGGTRFWVVTQARHDAAVQAGTAPNNCVVAITDDYPTGDTHTSVGSFDITVLSAGMMITANNTLSLGSHAAGWSDIQDFSSYIPANKSVAAWYGHALSFTSSGLMSFAIRVANGKLQVYSDSTVTLASFYLGTIFLPFV